MKQFLANFVLSSISPESVLSVFCVTMIHTTSLTQVLHQPFIFFYLPRLWFWYISLGHEFPKLSVSCAKLEITCGTPWWPAALAPTIAFGPAAPKPSTQESYTHHG
jgi:hypothetical protein